MGAPRWPVWASLNFGYDRERACSEALSLADHFIQLPVHHLTVKNRRDFWPIVPDEWYNDISYWSPAKGVITGSRPTWAGVNLTTTSGISARDALSGANIVQGKFHGEWVWSDLGKKVPYIQSLVEALPFDYFDTVRIMIIPVGGFGPIHADKIEGEEQHSEKDFVGLTLQLSDGGVPMQIKSRAGVRHDVNSPSFLFLDTVPHGVESPKSTRVTLRIYGKIDPIKLKWILNIRTAIW